MKTKPAKLESIKLDAKKGGNVLGDVISSRITHC